MELRDNYYWADKGKYFVLTETGKENVPSWRYDKVGEPVDEYGREAVHWAVEKGYLIEVDIPNWIQTTGYQVVYDYNGRTIAVGNPIVFHDLKLAENYKKNYESYPWMEHELYIIKTVYEGVKPQECREFNGKPVYNKDWWHSLDNFSIGDYLEEEIVEEVVYCLTPTCTRSHCMQCGEPTSHKIDEQGKIRETYSTFKMIAEGIYEYCGDCFAGENYRHGTEIPYV